MVEVTREREREIYMKISLLLNIKAVKKKKKFIAHTKHV